MESRRATGEKLGQKTISKGLIGVAPHGRFQNGVKLVNTKRAIGRGSHAVTLRETNLRKNATSLLRRVIPADAVMHVGRIVVFKELYGAVEFCRNA